MHLLYCSTHMGFNHGNRKELTARCKNAVTVTGYILQYTSRSRLFLCRGDVTMDDNYCYYRNIIVAYSLIKRMDESIVKRYGFLSGAHCCTVITVTTIVSHGLSEVPYVHCMYVYHLMNRLIKIINVR